MTFAVLAVALALRIPTGFVPDEDNGYFFANVQLPDAASLEKLFGDLAAARGLALGKVAQPVRVALTGGTASPGIYDVIVLLGKAESLRRLDDAIRLTG